MSAQLESSFVVDVGDGCINSSLLFTNNSTEALIYEWDFCPETITESIENTNIIGSTITTNYGFELVEDAGNWYGFGTDRANNKLLRFDYGNSPLNTPSVVDLGNVDNLLATPEGLSFIKVGVDWFGFVGYGINGGRIIKLNFGNSLSNVPSAAQMSDFGVFGSGRVRNLEAIQSNDSLYLVFPYYNGNSLAILNFRDNYDNVVAGADLKNYAIAGSSLPRGIDIKRINGDWFVVMVNEADNIQTMTLGNHLLKNTPVKLGDFTYTTTDRASHISLIQNGGKYFGFITSENKKLALLDFGDLISATTPVEMSNTDYPNYYGQFAQKFQGYIYVHGSVGGQLKRIAFKNVCAANEQYSNVAEPTGINFGNAGSYKIELRAYDVNGEVSTDIQSVIISSNQAPTISIAQGANICIDNTKVLTVIDTSDPTNQSTSYQWDFNGDDVVDLTQNTGDAGFGTASVDYTVYGGAGSYTVKVTGSNAGGCSNVISEAITMYESSATPTDLTATASSLCTFNEVTFSYPPLASLPAAASLIWDINGELSSTVDEPVYTFNTPGDKTISLQVVVPNCTTAVYNKTIPIATGPAVGFSYTNNCFGEAIAFADTSGVGNNYTWDFGDGSLTETNTTSFNPTHTYAATGTYSVSLTVANAQGCSTPSTQEIVVSDEPLADFTVGVSEANVPTAFTGIDQTLADNEVTGWSWDFGGLGTSTDQNPSFTFSSVASFEVSMTVATAQGCSATITKTAAVQEAEFPTATFTADVGDGCLGTSVTFSNSSVNAVGYEWDFCLGDFQVAQPMDSSTTVAAMTNGYGYTLVEDGGVWYSFIVAQSTSSIIRLTHGSSPLNAPSNVEDLGEFGLLNTPEAIDLIKFNGSWYGVVGGGVNGSKLTRLDFPAGLSGAVTGTDLGNFSNVGVRFRDVRLIEENQNLIMVFTVHNTNRIVRVDYGDSFDNVIDPVADVYNTTVTDLSLITGFDIQKIGGNYIVHALSVLNSNLVRFNFGSSLLSTPTKEDVYIIPDMDNGYRIRFLEEGGNYYGLIGSTGQNLRVFDFGTMVAAQTPTELTYTSSLPVTVAYEPIRYEGSSYVKGVQGSNFRTLTFAAVCDASEGFSSSFEPTGISYSTAGTKEIWLRALDAQGDASDVDNTVGISEAKVPEIVIQSFDTYCVLSEISFTSENLSTNITTYSWDFDGDQIIDSTDPIPTFQFSAAGTYNPRLDVVAANGCTNFVIDTLTIFPEPPTPSFSALLDDPCVDESVIITNLTDESGYEGLLQYTWEVTDIDSLLTGSSPALSFTTPGQKVISVISSIPGCESIAASDTVTINALPVVDFQGDLACIGTPTTFSNLSEGNQYQWQFGDGFQSTEMLPSHLYDAPGVYDVALFVEDENGCQDTLTQQVAVASIPNPSFQVDLICANEISVLQDQSSVVNADITAWEWLVSDTLFSTAQSPEISFSEAGSYEIEQRIMSSAGCEQSVIRQVQVLSDPIPEISYSRRCLGDEWVFHVGNSASDYITAQWTIEGVMVSSADSLTSIFTEADTVLIGLTLTNSNLCSATTETLVVITAAPLLDFSIDTSCSNEFTTFTNLSSSTADPIIGQEWFVNGISTASSRNFQRQFGQSGSYEIVLEVTTTSGCVYDQMQIIEIVSVPTAAFTASSNYGIEGSIIDFTNASTSAVAYIWLVNGDTISQALDAMYQFTESGNYTVTLVAENADGCYDQTASQVLIAQPSIDLVITSLQLQDGGDGFSNVVVEIANKSNLPVEQLTFQIQLDNGVTLRETIRQMIGINGNNVITLNTEVPMLAQLKSVCLQVSSNYGVADRVPEDNRQCVTFEQDELIFERPYPVPARDYLTIPMILPGNSNVKFELLQLSGQTVIKQNYLTEKKGLTNFRLELGAVEPGMYFLRVSVGGRSEITRVIVQ